MDRQPSRFQGQNSKLFAILIAAETFAQHMPQHIPRVQHMHLLTFNKSHNTALTQSTNNFDNSIISILQQPAETLEKKTNSHIQQSIQQTMQDKAL